MNYLYILFPKDLVYIIEDYSKDRTHYDNYDKVMLQLNLQSCVCDYGYYLTFRKRDYFKSKFYSILDDFSDWAKGGLYCEISSPVMNCEGKLYFDGIPRYNARKSTKTDKNWRK